ncbi:hypothetical protein ES319_D07G174800v1 [Gossypium barbadense]|uniref:Uncharacterized protein n=1 Tax=Gossypium barbadense TaxID=3634 RepID=A0A5J5QSL3_GOSBA|nr:hypothetical protein ES319_D07G174800v1 [Gossypium barbadense]
MTPMMRSQERKRRNLTTPFSPTLTTTEGPPSMKPRGGFRS